LKTGGRFLHPAATFQQHDAGALSKLIGERGLAIIIAVRDGRPLIAHAPVLIAAGRLRFHLSRANALVAALAASRRALAVVTGPDAYISPDWYSAADQVPTWNYLSAEIEGATRPLAPAETVDLLDDLSAHFEAKLAPKRPWSRDKLDSDQFETLLAAIVGYEMTIERCEGIAKLSQNKPSDEIKRVAGRLAARDDAGSKAVAHLMALHLTGEKRP